MSNSRTRFGIISSLGQNVNGLWVFLRAYLIFGETVILLRLIFMLMGKFLQEQEKEVSVEYLCIEHKVH